MKITSFTSQHNTPRRNAVLRRIRMAYRILFVRQVVVVSWDYPKSKDEATISVIYDKVSREGHWHAIQAYIDHDKGEHGMMEEVKKLT